MAAPLELARETVEDMKKQAFPETATWSLPGGKNVTELQETRVKPWKRGGARLCRSATQNAL